MSMEPYILTVDPKDLDKNWVLTRRFHPVLIGFGGSCTEEDELDIDFDGSQNVCIDTWIERCLQQNHSSNEVQELLHKLWYSEIAFPISLADIKLFKQMMNVNWRRSEFYKNRELYYYLHPLNERFYVKIRLALRAGKFLVVQYY